jgi:hypothetical protein
MKTSSVNPGEVFLRWMRLKIDRVRSNELEPLSPLAAQRSRHHGKTAVNDYQEKSHSRNLICETSSGKTAQKKPSRFPQEGFF